MNSKDVGNISEAKSLSRLLELGFKVLLPFGDNYRYDLVVDHNGSFYRIQVKTGHLKNGKIETSIRSINRQNGEYIRKNYKNDVDFICIYCPELDKIYMVPIDDCPDTSVILRVEYPKNNAKSNIRFAQEYEL